MHVPLLHRTMKGRATPETREKRTEQKITSSGQEKVENGKEFLLANKAKVDNKSLFNGTGMKKNQGKAGPLMNEGDNQINKSL